MFTKAPESYIGNLIEERQKQQQPVVVITPLIDAKRSWVRDQFIERDKGWVRINLTQEQRCLRTGQHRHCSHEMDELAEGEAHALAVRAIVWVIIIAVLISTFVLFSRPARSAEPPAATPSPEWVRGYCRGWHEAYEASLRNRDHFRTLLGLPAESHAAAIKRMRMYSGQKKVTGLSTVQQVQDTLLDGIDLYVVIAPGTTAILSDGLTFTCPK